MLKLTFRNFLCFLWDIIFERHVRVAHACLLVYEKIKLWLLFSGCHSSVSKIAQRLCMPLTGHVQPRDSWKHPRRNTPLRWVMMILDLFSLMREGSGACNVRLRLLTYKACCMQGDRVWTQSWSMGGALFVRAYRLSQLDYLDLGHMQA